MLNLSVLRHTVGSGDGGWYTDLVQFKANVERRGGRGMGARECYNDLICFKAFMLGGGNGGEGVV